MQGFKKGTDPSDESLVFVPEKDDFAVHFSMNNCCEFQPQLVRQLIDEVQYVSLLLAMIVSDGLCQPIEKLIVNRVFLLEFI